MSLCEVLEVVVLGVYIQAKLLYYVLEHMSLATYWQSTVLPANCNKFCGMHNWRQNT